MTTRKTIRIVLALAAAALAAPLAQAQVNDARVAEVLKSSFHPKGQAKLDRLEQDDLQKACSRAAASGKPLAPAVAHRLEKAQLAQVKYPADGKLMGDWKAGEKIAQTGVGLQYNDDPKKPAGGNCYACHELTKHEMAFGTMGPSLYHFGKKRGFTPAMQKYVYAKVYNPDAFMACTNMPRFGPHGILTEQQIRDVVALLMDPQSPVNQ